MAKDTKEKAVIGESTVFQDSKGDWWMGDVVLADDTSALVEITLGPDGKPPAGRTSMLIWFA